MHRGSVTLTLPGEIHTRDLEPRIVAAISRGSVDPDEVQVRIDGRRIAARVSVTDAKLILSLPRLREGRHDLTISSRSADWSKRTEKHTATLFVDATAPPGKLVIEQAAQAKQVRLKITVKSERQARLSVSVDAQVKRARNTTGTTTVAVTVPEGKHALEVRLEDRAGNVRRLTRTVWADPVPPTVRARVTDTVRTASGALKAHARDNRPPSELRARAEVDGATMPTRLRNDGSILATPAKPLSEGIHALTITVTDRAGNTTSANSRFLVDSTEQLGKAVLRSGARGQDVRLLQRELLRPNAWESAAPPKLQITGIYDEPTQAAVEQFQSSQSLAVDGVAGPFTIAALTLRIQIDQSSHRLVLHRYGRAYRTYKIAVGQPKYPTPNGTFRIVDKQKNPTWTPPDSEWAKDEKVTPPGPDNPLGTRWMGLDSPGIGIHGTNSPQSLGYSVSHGCVRMAIADVEQLFDLVDEGTKVEIRP